MYGCALRRVVAFVMFRLRVTGVAGMKLVLPACLAVVEHVPTPLSVSTASETEHGPAASYVTAKVLDALGCPNVLGRSRRARRTAR